MKKPIRIILCGLGGVGQAFLNLLVERRTHVSQKYGLDLRLTAAVDIGGAALCQEKQGLPLNQLCKHLLEGKAVERAANFGKPGMTGKMALLQNPCDVLIEATPTNLVDGEPGTTHIITALEQGMEVVSANKGPLVLHYRKLHDLAQRNKCALHISAATAAALPTLDVGSVCLAGSHILSVEGILNGTTNYILSRMQLEGCAYATALEDAQALGIAETDPSYDVEGKDTANKIILIANRIFGTRYGPDDIRVTGITDVSLEDIKKASEDKRVIKLIGTAARSEDKMVIEVAPKRLKRDHPLALVNGSEKAISYMTDTMDRVTVMGGKSSPVGAAAAILKDLINAYI